MDAEQFENTQSFFLKHLEHGYSFTDCLSLVVMRQLKIKEVMTTDRHFKQVGLDPVLV